MSDRNFYHLLHKRWEADRLVCVGLDSDVRKLPAHVRGDDIEKSLTQFNRALIDSTAEVTGVYKIQSSFYEAHGAAGISALKETIAYINQAAPEIPVIVDAKRADIGSSNEGYVQAVFGEWGADAVTLQPYLGEEALRPFLDLENKGLIILCRTSNPGSGELQERQLVLSDQEWDELLSGPAGSFGTRQDGPIPLYLYVALRVANHWNRHGNCALVTGATYPQELASIRQNVGDLPFLIPGIGAQGGDLEATVQAGKDSQNLGMMINSSRGIIFASSGEDFAERAGEEAKKLNDSINYYRHASK